MDKGLLLVLLCLQVVLLTTAFTSTDEAALLRDDQHQLQPVDLQVKDTGGEEVKIRVRRGCGKRRGACTIIGVRQLPTNDQHQLKPGGLIGSLQELRKKGEKKKKRLVWKSCGNRPGACSPLIVKPLGPGEQIKLSKVRLCRNCHRMQKTANE